MSTPRPDGLRADADARAFFSLTPERVLEAVEAGGARRATGFVLALNSLENRVYEVALEEGDPVVAKFYRPGRWSEAALADEHALLAELEEADVPVVAPLALAEGATLGRTPEGILFALFPKVRGRVPEELDDEQLAIIGRLVARLHLVGERRDAPARPLFEPGAIGGAALRVLAESGVVPPELEARVESAGQELVRAATARWPRDRLRLHGDCHLGNLLVSSQGSFFLVDFDDCCIGPAAQDLWLVSPGRDDEARRQRRLVVDAYQELRRLDDPEGALAAVEALRGLRVLRYAAWTAARFADPSFARAFPHFRDSAFWQREVATWADITRAATAGEG